MESKGSKRAGSAKDWKCQECGCRMTMAAASRAMSTGCLRCGGSDVELDEDQKPVTK